MEKTSVLLASGMILFGVLLCSCDKNSNYISSQDDLLQIGVESNENSDADESMCETDEENGLSLVTDSTRLSMNITEGMTIDAEVISPNVNQYKIYQAVEKKANLEVIKAVLFDDVENLTYDYNENSDVDIIDSEDGRSLLNGVGDMEFTFDDNTWELYNLIQYAYGLDGATTERTYMSSDEIAACEQNPIITNVKEQLAEMYQLSPEVEFTIEKCYEVNFKDLLAAQKEFEETGELTEGELAIFGEDKDECYYLSFGLQVNGIPCSGNNEPSIEVSNDDAVVLSSCAEVIVSENGIQFLYTNGIFDVSPLNDTNIISVEAATESIKQKYESTILTKQYTINRIWLEYLFIHDSADRSGSIGKLIPHWCFQNEHSSNNGMSYGADRISAVTGEDFKYVA